MDTRNVMSIDAIRESMRKASAVRVINYRGETDSSYVRHHREDGSEYWLQAWDGSEKTEEIAPDAVANELALFSMLGIGFVFED